MDAKLRLSPRFSINKLAEYMSASPRRRRSLIIDQIRVPVAKVINYEDARRVLVRFFGDPDRTPKQLLDTAATFRDRAALSPEEHRSQCLISSARALEAFAPFSDHFRPRGVVAVPGPRKGADLTLGGVRVVVAPDISLIEPGTEQRVGAIKFHFSRSAPLSAEGLQYSSTLLYEHLERDWDRPTKSRCISVDIFGHRAEAVPRAVKDRLKNLEAACEEISERWPTLVDLARAQGALQAEA